MFADQEIFAFLSKLEMSIKKKGCDKFMVKIGKLFGDAVAKWRRVLLWRENEQKNKNIRGSPMPYGFAPPLLPPGMGILKDYSLANSYW